MMALQIKRIFENDKLANKLSVNAKSVALKRHNVFQTTNQYMDIYRDVIQLHKNRSKSL